MLLPKRACYLKGIKNSLFLQFSVTKDFVLRIILLNHHTVMSLIGFSKAAWFVLVMYQSIFA